MYKFTLTDEEKQEQQSRSKVSRDDQRKVYDDDNDCIEEEVVEKDQSVFRFKESSTEEDRKRSRRKARSLSSSSSSSRKAKDVECWRYYYKGKRSRQKKECGRCYHIVYNVFTMLPDQKESEEEGERSLKKAMHHVHPKLPDYDQIVAHFTALRKQQQQQKHKRSL